MRTLSRVCEEERTRKITIANDQLLYVMATHNGKGGRQITCHHEIKDVPLKKGPMGSIKRNKFGGIIKVS